MEDLKIPLNKLLNKMLGYISNVEDFMSENVPDFIKQVIQFELYDSIFTLLCFVFLVVLSIILAVKSLKYFNKKLANEEGGDGDTVFSFILMLAFICSACISCYNIYCQTSHIIKLVVAPKLFVVEYIADKIK